VRWRGEIEGEMERNRIVFKKGEFYYYCYTQAEQSTLHRQARACVCVVVFFFLFDHCNNTATTRICHAGTTDPRPADKETRTEDERECQGRCVVGRLQHVPVGALACVCACVCASLPQSLSPIVPAPNLQPRAISILLRRASS